MCLYRRYFFFGLLLNLIACDQPDAVPATHPAFETARQNGIQAREALVRSHQYLHGWLAHTDPESGLIPTNLETKSNLWEPHNAAADNYAFMVLTTYLTEPDFFAGQMQDMLQSETERTSRVGPLPDTYSFSDQDFHFAEPDLDRIIFGSSEYIKDGLLPITELMGPSPWSERMISILNALWENASYSTPFGDLISQDVEVNGEMLQVLSRVYWMTGEERYLDWAIRIGDYYLLGDNHPTKNMTRLRLRDHGCEVVSGLTELYATVFHTGNSRYEVYKQPLHDMLDRILEVGRNEHGLFYNLINPPTGEVLNLRNPNGPDNMADTFGYTLNGYYTVYQIDSVEAYRNAVLEALSSLQNYYKAYDWESGSSDGYADAIEGALNLYNRESLPAVGRWIDEEIQIMWDKQQEDGVIEGWHGDGNFARTSIMYALWKSQGLRAIPWRDDLRLGAERSGDTLFVVMSADSIWHGSLQLDVPRHTQFMQLPADWPRINQFPEWYVEHQTDLQTQLDQLTVQPDEETRLVLH